MPRRPERTCAEHHAQSSGHVAHAVLLEFAVQRVVAAKAKPCAPFIAVERMWMFLGGTEDRLPGGLQQHDSEDDGDGVGADVRRESRTYHRTDRSGDFKEHSDADVGIALAHVCGSRSGRCRDDGDERCTDGVFEVDAERERKGGNHDDAATESGQRAQESSERRDGPDHDSEGEYRHEAQEQSLAELAASPAPAQRISESLVHAALTILLCGGGGAGWEYSLD
jgi:hypothetical protein